MDGYTPLPPLAGTLHRHADGTEHRHSDAGLTIGGQVIPDHDGTEDHEHGAMGSRATSGPVVWDAEHGDRLEDRKS